MKLFKYFILKSILIIFFYSCAGTTTQSELLNGKSNDSNKVEAAVKVPNEKLIKVLEDAFKAPTKEDLLPLFSEKTVCGPFLWSELEKNYAEIYTNSVAQFITFNTLNGYPQNVVNFPIGIFSTEKGDLSAFLGHFLELYGDAKNLRVRKATDEEKKQYHLILTFAGKKSPTFIVELGSHLILLEFNTSETITSIEYLNEFNEKFDPIFKKAVEKKYQDFVTEKLKQFATREDAAKAYAQAGGHALFNETNFKKALGLFQTGVLLDPENYTCYFGQCMVINNGVRNKILSPQLLDDAMWCGKKALSLNPNEPRTHGDLAWTCIILSDYKTIKERDELLERADSLCNRAIELEPDFGQYYYISSIVKTMQGDMSDAYDLAMKAKERDYSMPPNYLEMLNKDNNKNTIE